MMSQMTIQALEQVPAQVLVQAQALVHQLAVMTTMTIQALEQVPAQVLELELELVLAPVLELEQELNF
jgi:hypothetical protein